MRAINGALVWEASPGGLLAYMRTTTHVLFHVDRSIRRSDRGSMGAVAPSSRPYADVVFCVRLVPHVGVARLRGVAVGWATIDALAPPDDLHIPLVTGSMVLLRGRKFPFEQLVLRLSAPCSVGTVERHCAVIRHRTARAVARRTPVGCSGSLSTRPGTGTADTTLGT